MRQSRSHRSMDQSRFSWSSTLGIAIALTLAGHGSVAAEQVLSIEGLYTRGDPSPSEVRIAARPNGRFRVEIHGGGDRRMGAGAGADCYAVAEGELAGDRLRAAFVPFSAAGLDFSAEDLGGHPRQLEVRLDGQDIEVTGDFDYCALHTYLAGRYRREEHSRSFEGCPSGGWSCWADK